MDWPNRILVCLRYGIGDVIMELPALRAVRAQWPRAHVTVLGARPALELLDDDPDFDARVCVQDFGFDHWGDWGRPQAHDAFWDWYNANGFDCVLDGSHAVAGVRVALGYAPTVQRNTGEHFHPRAGAGGAGAESIWRAAIRAWGLRAPPSAPPPRLFVSPAAAQRSRRLLRQQGIGRDLVALAPIGSSPLKRWPDLRMEAVVRWLANERGREVLVFGLGSEQRELGERLWAAAPGHVHVIAPRHLQETAALLARCDAFLGNDTGLMHMAAAVGTPTVAIFGPTSPRVYLPGGAMAVAAAGPCAHRPEDRFGPPRCVLQGRCLVAEESCITTVSVESVCAALERALSPATLVSHADGEGVRP